MISAALFRCRRDPDAGGLTPGWAATASKAGVAAALSAVSPAGPLMVIATLFAVGSSAALLAQSAPTTTVQGIEMDSATQAILDAWEKREYNLGRMGVRTIQFTVTATVESPLGKATGKGKYSFKNGRSTLKWDKPAVRRIFDLRGWTATGFQRLFVPDARRRELRGTKLTQTTDAAGTVVRVEGKNPANLRSLHFDQKGRLKAQRFGQSAVLGTGPFTEITLRFAPIGRRLARSGWSFTVKNEKGSVTADVKVTRKPVGKFRVFAKLTETLTIGDRPLATHTLMFEEYKINGVLVEPKPPAAKPPAGEKPETGSAASKPTGKAGPTSRPGSAVGEKVGKKGAK